MMSNLIQVRSPHWGVVCYKPVPYFRANVGSYSCVYSFGLILALNSHTLFTMKKDPMGLGEEEAALHAKMVLQ